jgi:CheY-like chemotaxis protein
VIRAVIVSASALVAELGHTVLFRRNVERLQASRTEDVLRIADGGRVALVVVDSALPGAAAVVEALRQDPLTRSTAIVALGRSEFGFGHLGLLEAGANAVMLMPPDRDWDDRLTRLMHVPARRAARLPADVTIAGGLSGGLSFTGRVVDLSVHGILLECPHPLEVGEDLSLSFVMPGQGGVRGTGTVVRVAEGDRFGVELTHVEGDGRAQIKRYVESGVPD